MEKGRKTQHLSEKYNVGVSLWKGVDLNFKKILEEYNGELEVRRDSKQPIRIRVTLDEIRVDLLREEDSYFEAKLKKDERGKSLLEFDMKTDEEETGIPIPGLYAQKLISRVIEYFDKKNIDYINFTWHEDNAKYEKRIGDIENRWTKIKQKLK